MNVDYVKLMAANEVLRSGEVNYKALKYVTDYLEALAQIIPAEARKFEANQAIFAIPYLKFERKSWINSSKRRNLSFY